MPIYEYRCVDCHRKSSFLTRSVNAELEPVCSHCGGKEMERLISRVSFKVSSSSPGADYYSDPSNIGRHVEDSFQKAGMDVPDSVRETIDKARGGKMPEGLDI